MVFLIVRTPWPTSKGLDYPYLHVYACLLLCFMLMLASHVLGFATLDALCGYVVMRLRSTPRRPCLHVTTWDTSSWCRLLRTCLSSFLLFAMICLPCLFVPPVDFICIFTRLLTCPCMSLAWYCVVHASTQWSYGHSIQTYICPSRTPSFVCFLACLPFLLVCLLSCYACHFYHAYLLYASFTYPLHPFLPLLVYWFLVFAFACTHMERGCLS